MGTRPGWGASGRSEIEAALRYLGTRDHGVPVDILRHAIDRPQRQTGSRLAALTAPTEHLADWSADERARAVWHIILEGVRDPDVSPTPQSRRGRVLRAAFRMADPDIHEQWRSSLTERFRQLKALTTVFNEPTTTQPMEMAWKRGVRDLAGYVERRFNELTKADAWESLKAVKREVGTWPGVPDEAFSDDESEFRPPSPGAQSVFVDLFVTTVLMRQRAVHRRITERLVKAKSDGVAFYAARGSTVGDGGRAEYVPVQALWGCRAEFVEPSQPGWPAVTRLWFPAVLQRGQQAYFASEAVFAVDDSHSADRDWINVNIDHHGIARGKTAHGGRLPVAGLTIRVIFDDLCLPESVWWYAELNERERYDRPEPGDSRLLSLEGNTVQYTFTEYPCQPRENYGLSFSWPA